MEYTQSRESLGSLKCLVFSPRPEQATHLVILCHGFGASSDDLAGLGLSFLQTPKENYLPAIVLPAAPLDLTSQGIPGGRAWWYLNMARLLEATQTGTFDELRKEIPDGLERAALLLQETIEAAKVKFPNAVGRFTLAGFSQGAMLSTHVALCCLQTPPQVLGIMSGALIAEDEWMAKAPTLAHAPLKIIQSHGRQDPILPFQTGQWLFDLLTNAGCDVQFLPFQGPHTISEQMQTRLVESTQDLSPA